MQKTLDHPYNSNRKLSLLVLLGWWGLIAYPQIYGRHTDSLSHYNLLPSSELNLKHCWPLTISKNLLLLTSWKIWTNLLNFWDKNCGKAFKSNIDETLKYHSHREYFQKFLRNWKNTTIKVNGELKHFHVNKRAYSTFPKKIQQTQNNE